MGDAPEAASAFAPTTAWHKRNLAYFFGEPNDPQKMKDYSEHHALTYHFPDAYVGSNVKLRETLNNLVLASPDDWQTSVCLPFHQIDGTTVEWDEIRFDVRLMQRVPYEGVSRMQTSLRRRHRDRVVRRGIGLVIESDFYGTEAGRTHLKNQLLGIRYCVQETCNFDVMYALLAAPNYDHRYDLDRGLSSKQKPLQTLKHEVSMYGIVQKQEKGMEVMVEHCKHRMHRYRVTPNMLIVPPELLLYIATAPDERITYSSGGATAVTKFEEGVDGYRARAFRGLGVFESAAFDMQDESSTMQMLKRTTQVGEFYRMRASDAFGPNKHGTSAFADISIYDESCDRLAHISYKQALRKACPDNNVLASLFSDGKVVTAQEDPRASPALKLIIDAQDPAVKARGLGMLVAWLALLHYYAGEGATSFAETCKTFLTDATDPASKRAAMEHVNQLKSTAIQRLGTDPNFANKPPVVGYDKLGELYHSDALTNNAAGYNALVVSVLTENRTARHPRLTLEDLIELNEARLPTPFEIVLARPHIQHETYSAILCVSGPDTGCTLYGPADMQLSGNVSVKTIEGHFTCHTRAVVTRPENVFVARDIMLAGYDGGCNVKFHPLPDAGSTHSFDNEITDDSESIYAFLHLTLDDDACADTLALAGRLHPSGTTTSSESNASSALLRIDPFYTKRFGFDKMHMGEDHAGMAAQSFMLARQPTNSLCFVGPHRVYSPYSQNFYELVPGQGHLGSDALPGDAKWRRGETLTCQAARDATVLGFAGATAIAAHRPMNAAAS